MNAPPVLPTSAPPAATGTVVTTVRPGTGASKRTPPRASTVPPQASGTAATADHASNPIDRLAVLLDLVSQVQNAGSEDAACRVLAIAAAEHLHAARVAVGLRPTSGGACTVRAFSDTDAFDPRSEAAQAAQAALQEVIARGEPAVWPPANESSRHALLAHRRWLEFTSGSSVASGLFRDQRGVVQGAWLVALTVVSKPTDRVVEFLRTAETPLAAALRLQMRATRSRWWKLLETARENLRGRRRWLAGAALLAVAAVLAIPTTSHIRCPCVVEPTVRRHVAAPFAGPLEQAFVEPGDLVAAGQVLAVMDGRETRWELAGVRADFQRADKERAGHVATHESGKAELSRLERDRLGLRLQLLEHRDENLRIRSPITGIVVSGDLKKSEGSPLTVGQALFEIAPLDSMVVELAIAASDITYVRPGMTVTFRLDSSPFTPRQATIGRIHPRAEVRDGEHVFVAEVPMQNGDDAFRPGMHGWARIDGYRYPLAWNLLRKPLGALASWLGR